MAGQAAKATAKGTWKIAAFTLNFFIPGVGTLLLGRIGTGIIQLILLAVGIVTIAFGIGFLIILGVWIWGMVTVVNAKPKQQVVVIAQQPGDGPPTAA